MLITHIESVRDAVDRVVEVRYDAESGTSVVRQQDRDDDEAELAVAGPTIGGYGDLADLDAAQAGG